MFELLCAISQNKKMDGLRRVQKFLAELPHKIESRPGFTYPNIISPIILPIL